MADEKENPEVKTGDENAVSPDLTSASDESQKSEREASVEPMFEEASHSEHESGNENQSSKDIEELTSVVLSSAEVSTRSAAVAADVTRELRQTMKQIRDDHKSNVLQSRVMLFGMLAFLLIALGTFFAIATRMQQNIRQLDAIALAVGKRVVELDATVGTFVNTSNAFAELGDKLEAVDAQQDKIDHKFEEINKTLAGAATKTSDTTMDAIKAVKLLDDKFVTLQKQLTALEGKVQTVATRPILMPPAPVVNTNQQAVIAEIQKLKKDMEASNAKLMKERAEPTPVKAAPVRLPEPKKPADAKATEVKAVPEPKPESKPEPKVAETPAPAPKPRDNRVYFPRPNDAN